MPWHPSGSCTSSLGSVNCEVLSGLWIMKQVLQIMFHNCREPCKVWYQLQKSSIQWLEWSVRCLTISYLPKRSKGVQKTSEQLRPLSYLLGKWDIVGHLEFHSKHLSDSFCSWDDTLQISLWLQNIICNTRFTIHQSIKTAWKKSDPQGQTPVLPWWHVVGVVWQIR